MTATPTRRRLTAVLAAACGVALLATQAPPAGAQEDSWVREELGVSTETPLAGSDYGFTAEVDQPTPATVYGVPDALTEGTHPLTVTWHWGDGTPGETYRSDEEPTPVAPGSLWCNAAYEETGDPPVYVPGESFGYDCGTSTGHTYRQQGLYMLTLTAAQPQAEGVDPVTSESAVFPQLVTDLAKGGSLTGKGTVKAPAGSGGMYDQDYGGGTLTFSVSAQRLSRSAATTALVTVSVPSMRPDWPPGAGTKGLEFTGRAALWPLWVRKIKSPTGVVTGGEVWVRRIEGRVTNSAGFAGTAWATIHALVRKGRATLVRVSLQNTSAGFTYVDTGAPLGWTELRSTHKLLTGKLTVR